MKRIMFLVALAFIAMVTMSGNAFSANKVIYGFETDLGGWEIPDWALEQKDYVAEDVTLSKEFAKEGKGSAKMVVNFPPDKWSSALIEVIEYFDWTPYGKISCDIYIPESAPNGLKAKVILTVGEDWKWTEMSRSINLKPGAWTTITANLKPGSTDWKQLNPTDEFRADVRKLAIRVSSSKPAYKGPIYIDSVVLSE